MDVWFCVELIATAVALAGCWLNNHRLRAGFMVWILSNVICGVLHWRGEMMGLVIRDALFSLLAVHGFYKWSDTKKGIDHAGRKDF